MMATPATPRPPGARTARLLYHLGATCLFAALAGAGIVWPQWLAADGAGVALDIQTERRQELTDRLDVLRAANGRLREWARTDRRVFLVSEAHRLPRVARTIAERNGVVVAKFAVTGRPSPRWRGVTVQAGTDAPESIGEIQPRELRVVVQGSFEGVYRTIATLCQQQQFFIPDRWTMAPVGPREAGTVRAQLAATIFVVDEPEDEVPTISPAGDTRLALSEAKP